MSSWIKCPCGENLHKNLFTGADVRVVVSDTILDQIPEEATAADCVSDIIARGEILVNCTECGRIAIEDRHGVISIYSKES